MKLIHTIHYTYFSFYLEGKVDKMNQFLGAFAKLRKVTISFAMPIRPSAWNNSAATDRFS
jgi:hypothetical protein